MIPISDNPAKMEIDEEGLIVGVTNRLRTIRYFGKISFIQLYYFKTLISLHFPIRKHFRKLRRHCNW